MKKKNPERKVKEKRRVKVGREKIGGLKVVKRERKLLD